MLVQGNSAAGCDNPIEITVTVTNENDNIPLCDPQAIYLTVADRQTAGTAFIQKCISESKYSQIFKN